MATKRPSSNRELADQQRAKVLGNSSSDSLKVLLKPLLAVGLLAIAYHSCSTLPVQKTDWITDDAPAACEVSLKQQLRDPDSYQKASGLAITASTATSRQFTWAFRSRNGFGGMGNGMATCDANIPAQTVSTTVTQLP